MREWDGGDLDLLHRAREVEIAARWEDGSTATSVPIWIVCVDGGAYIRSWRGARAAWFRSVREAGTALIRVGGTELAVIVEPSPDVERAAVDRAYRAKYDGSTYVDAMVADTAAATTTRLVPAG